MERSIILFNFASPASPVDYARLGPETLNVGSQGTRNVLDLARKYQAGFLHASTSECYGDPEVHPQAETYWGHVNPIGPRSVYDEAKRFSEALIMAYHRYYSVDTHMVRIFNTYGPRLQPTDGRVISNLMIQALLDEDLTVYGDGIQTRSFCYVSDLIAGIILLSRSNEHLPVNIGNPVEWTIKDCAREVLTVTGSRSKIRYEPLPIDDPMQRCPDITQGKNPSRLGAEDRSSPGPRAVPRILSSQPADALPLGWGFWPPLQSRGTQQKARLRLQHVSLLVFARQRSPTRLFLKEKSHFA